MYVFMCVYVCLCVFVCVCAYAVGATSLECLVPTPKNRQEIKACVYVYVVF